MPPLKTIKIRVTGRVQGIWFRGSAKREAERLGITGYAKNEEDGSVELVAQAKDPLMFQEFLKWCQDGPSIARIEKLTWSEFPGAPQYEEFQVR